MRPCHNPYGGVNPLIDKMIGNAYDIVKYVAANLKYIRYLAENMSIIYDVAHGYRFQIEGTPEGSNSLFLQLPSELPFDAITGVEVIAILGSQIYVASPTTFNYGIDNDEVVISITLSDLEYAEFRATVTTIAPSSIGS